MVLIKCYLANKDVLETETVLCEPKLNQRSVLESTLTIAEIVESLTIVCYNSVVNIVMKTNKQRANTAEVRKSLLY